MDRKYLKGFGKAVLGIGIGLVLYAGVCREVNRAVCSSQVLLSPEKAKEIIEYRSKSEALKDKKINFVALDNESLSGSSIGAFVYSSENEFYIVCDKNDLKKTFVLHELAHIVLGKPQEGKVELESILNWVGERKGKETFSSPWERIKYTLSPEELFCNVYALVN